MRYVEARPGRVFILRLEDGEMLHTTIEDFAARQGIRSGILIALGGADSGSRLVVGPEDGKARPVDPMTIELDDVHEIVGTGNLFPDEEGRPMLHLHLACGRGRESVTGCARAGVKVWQVIEVVLIEIIDTTAGRRLDPSLGVTLLEP